jgi:hypothetical protein
MYKERKDIILRSESGHIIGKASCIYRDFLPCNRTQYIILQIVKVHININLKRFKGFRLVPVVSNFSKPHTAHHRTGVIHVFFRFKEVTVISAFHFFHFHPVPDAELLHFSFRKTHAGG